jgi:hypothetical protein
MTLTPSVGTSCLLQSFVAWWCAGARACSTSYILEGALHLILSGIQSCTLPLIFRTYTLLLFPSLSLSLCFYISHSTLHALLITPSSTVFALFIQRYSLGFASLSLGGLIPSSSYISFYSIYCQSIYIPYKSIT